MPLPRPIALLLAFAAAPLAGCSRYVGDAPIDPAPTLVEVASFEHPEQITGVAVSRSGRVFVNSPLWHDGHTWAVAEVLADGSHTPYPDAGWNSFREGDEGAVGSRFVCVQSVYVDGADRLWVLDPGAPRLKGPLPGAPKLVEIDLAQDSVVRVIPFSEAIAPLGSYLNDVRVSVNRNAAFITDSGLGAIVVVDLSTGAARRLLADDPSTKADVEVVPVVGARPLKMVNGMPLIVHSDGLALDEAGGWLYWQALTSRTLHRAPVDALLDASMPAESLAASVENFGRSPVTDGMEVDDLGRLCFTALEYDAVVVRALDGAYFTAAAQPGIAWPDSLAWGPGGWLYFTTSQIHRTAWFTPDGSQPTEPYRLWKTRVRR